MLLFAATKENAGYHHASIATTVAVFNNQAYQREIDGSWLEKLARWIFFPEKSILVCSFYLAD